MRQADALLAMTIASSGSYRSRQRGREDASVARDAGPDAGAQHDAGGASEIEWWIDPVPLIPPSSIAVSVEGFELARAEERRGPPVRWALSVPGIR